MASPKPTRPNLTVSRWDSSHAAYVPQESVSLYLARMPGFDTQRDASICKEGRWRRRESPTSGEERETWAASNAALALRGSLEEIERDAGS
jgi:hypothetical protein